MAKPNIQNITTTQTFQNWFDKTNEMVDIMRDSAITASVSGDITIGDAALAGEFTANTIVAYDELKIDTAVARVPGQEIDFISPTRFTLTSGGPSAIFQNTSTGGTTRYTTGTESWDIGYDNTTDLNFVIETGLGGQFSLGGSGVLTVGSLVTKTDAVIETNLTVGNNLSGNTATFTSITGDLTGNVTGDVTGDVYQPDGVTKVFENGTAGIPAQFTGNVLGTVSSLTNHTTNSLSEGSNNLYFTTARARNSITAGTGVSYNSTDGRIAIGQNVNINADVNFASVETTGDITAAGSIEADSFAGDGSQLTGIKKPPVKAWIAFNGSSGYVVGAEGLSLSKSGTGRYIINILEGYRPPTNQYCVLLGNVDPKNPLQAPVNTTDTLNLWNTYVDTVLTNLFSLRAVRSYSFIKGGMVADDNNITSIFGVEYVDPGYITVALIY